MNKEANMYEEEIILAPHTELLDEATEISRSTKSDEKFFFALQYDTNQKEFLLSMLGTVGAIVENDDDDGHILATMMNMTQLAFIKQLDCVERVKTDEGEVRNPFLMEEATPDGEVQTKLVINRMTNANIEAVADAESDQANDGIAVASVTASARSSCSGCPTNTDQANAQNITVETLVSGCICCPGTEQWFKFTVPSSKQYTIFTTGSLDTEGELSGCCLATPIYNDDFAGRVNFRIITSLCAGYEYYIKVSAKHDATGSYTLKVTEQVLAESVTINSQRSDGIILLEEGKTYELPRGEGYSYLYSDGALDGDGTPICHVPMSVDVTPEGVTEKRVYWYASSIPSDPVDTDFTWYDNTTKYQTITANSCGAAKLYAYDWLERGKRGEIYVVVAPSVGQFVKASSFKICKEGTTTEISELNMEIGEYQKVIAEVSPSTATVKNVNWVSTNPDVATITPYGRIKAVSYGTTIIRAEPMDGGEAIAELKVNVLGYYYISNKTDNNKVVSYKNALDGALTGIRSNRADVCVEQFTKCAKQIWRITNISSEVDGNIKAYYDEDYGFNAYRGTSGNFNCDLIKVDGNEDAAVRFVSQGNGYYKIHLSNDLYSEYYLTLESDGVDVRWRNADQGDRQLWKLNVVDWEQYESEHVEYHLLCNGDTSMALRVGTKNVLEIDTSLPVRGERLSYWNRQKWTIKGDGTQKRLCSQLNNEYFLCNDGSGNAYISDNASAENSYLTVTPYGNSGGYTIKLTNSNLYLTLVYDETDNLYWGKWLTFDSASPTMQIWHFKEQPIINQRGVDTNKQISTTTAKILKKEGINFAIKYYATKANINSWNYDKILTKKEVEALHGAGLKIVVVYEDGGINFSTERGISDATEALRLATELGQTAGSAIYFGVEPNASNLSLINDYFKAVKNVFDSDGRFKLGVYGTASVCTSIKYNKDTQTDYVDYTWLGQTTGNSTVEGDDAYINYDKSEKYDIKQSDYVSYNEIVFDNDTAIVDQYGQW